MTEAEVLDIIPIAAAVITSGTEANPVGFTGSVWGEARNPGWLAVPVSAESSTLPTVVETGRIGVNVLGEHATDLVATFARRVEHSGQRFDGVDWAYRHGVPVLTAGVAWFACSLDSVQPFGRYRILICRVVRSGAGSRAAPLVWVNGRGVLAEPRTTQEDR